MAGCSAFYFWTKLDITRLVPMIMYFSYMTIVSYGFFCLTGTIGFYACYIFVRQIYSAVKVSTHQYQYVRTVSDVLTVFSSNANKLRWLSSCRRLTETIPALDVVAASWPWQAFVTRWIERSRGSWKEAQHHAVLGHV